MEIIIAVLSLQWVVGILSLQRLDAVIDEFVKADAYYLSLDKTGAIDPKQLSLKSLLPKTAVQRLVAEISKYPQSAKQTKMKESLKFYAAGEKVKAGLENLLIANTLLLPAIHLIDFSSIPWLTFADKDLVVYSLLVVIVAAAFSAQKIIVRLSSAHYPINIHIDPRAQY